MSHSFSKQPAVLGACPRSGPSSAGFVAEAFGLVSPSRPNCAAHPDAREASRLVSPSRSRAGGGER